MSDVTDVQVPILRRHLQELKLQDGVRSGYLSLGTSLLSSGRRERVKTEDDVKQLERSLAAANVNFSVRSSRRKPGNNVFHSANGDVQIDLDLVSFRVTGDATKQCTFGDEYYKKSDAQHQACSLKTKKKLRNLIFWFSVISWL
ncbi:hypothetical protein MRX96_059838 [Rhipicephalus microplus]